MRGAYRAFQEFNVVKTMRNPQNLIVVSQDEYEKLQVQAEMFTLAGAIHAIDVLQAAKERMFGALTGGWSWKWRC